MRDDNEKDQRGSNPFQHMRYNPQEDDQHKHRVVGNVKRRKFVLSDSDDDEDIPTPKVSKTSIPCAEEWLDRRDASSMPISELKANICSAKAARKSALIPKKKNTVIDDIVDDDRQSPASVSKASDDLCDTPLSISLSKNKGYSYTLESDNISALLKERDAAAKVEDSRSRKDREREERLRARRSGRSSSRTQTGRRRKMVLSDSEDSTGEEDEGQEHNGENEEGWEEEERERKCREVLGRCARVSHQLRSALERWSGHGGKKDMDGCVDLTSFDAQVQEHVGGALTQKEVEANCPGLALKDYQLVGVNWLKLLHISDVNGVLADDMGLGKTVQTIAFLGWLHHSQDQKQEGGSGAHLIVVPASTISNWAKELERFCPALSVVRFHGSQAEKQELKGLLRRSLIDGNGEDPVHIVLTTYTMFERESGAEDRAFLRKIKFEYLVLDEAHCIKNASSSRYSHLRNLKTRRRLLLSGTPVQNDLRELLALLGFLMPEVFRSEYTEMLLESFQIDKFSSEMAIATSSDQVSDEEPPLANLRRMLAPFVLRRLKKDVLHQLVAKKDVLLRVPMTETQRKLYEDIIKKHMLRRSSGEKGDSNNDDYKEHIVRSISTSEANNIFSTLRKAANHPLLLRVRYSDDAVIDEISTVLYATGHFGDQCDIARVREEVKQFSDFDINHLCLEYPSHLGHLQLSSDVLYDSPKLRQLRDMLPALISSGHRVLVFSQWTRMLDIIGAFLQDLSLHFLRLDGSTPVGERQKLIDKFERDATIPVFLLSTKAGGLGINLTAADTVVIHDLDFNPENDRQAEDRCHRIGQTKLVTVYKMVAENTVDECIYDMGERKQKLSKAVLSGSTVQKINAENAADTDRKSEIGHMLQIALQKCLQPLHTEPGIA